MQEDEGKYVPLSEKYIPSRLDKKSVPDYDITKITTDFEACFDKRLSFSSRKILAATLGYQCQMRGDSCHIGKKTPKEILEELPANLKKSYLEGIIKALKEKLEQDS